MNKMKNLIINNYYLLLSLLMFLYSIYKYNQFNSLNIYIVLYVLMTIGLLIFHFFHSKIYKWKISNILPKNKFMMFIFIIVILTSLSCYSNNSDRIFYRQNDASSNVGAILVEPITQKITTKGITIDSVYVRFATYGRSNNADYKMNLLENDVVIYERIFNSNILNDGQFFRFKIGERYLNEDSEYEIVITPIYATSNDCISVFKSEKSDEINYMLATVDGIDYFKVFSILGIFLIFLVFNYIINTRNLKPEKFYLLTGIYMLIILFIIPPWNVPDEPVHFFRAYKLSQVAVSDHMIEDSQNMNLYGPVIWCIDYAKIQQRDRVYNRNDIVNCLKEQENIDDNYYLVTNQMNNNPINHLVPAVGIKIVDKFTNSPLLIFFAGRLFNCLLSLLIVYFAIKNVSKNKLIILLVATIPMFIQQMCSYSYDSLLNAFSILLLSYSMRILEKDNLKIKDYILISFSTIFIFSAKMIYIFLLAPLFFRKTDNKKQFWKNIFILFIIIIISYIIVKIWPYILNKVIVSKIESSTSSNGSNIEYLLSQPFDLFMIIYNTFAKNTMFYLRGLFGYFGWFMYRIDDIYIWIYLLMFYIVLKNNKLSETVFDKKEKIVSIIMCLIMFAATFAAMYFYWSSYKLHYIDGVQGRYFIPFIGLLLVTLIPKKKYEFKISENDIYVFINLMLMMTNILLICSFY